MALKKKPVTGMKDILPAEMAIRDYVIRLIKETYGTFGFSSIETPCVEHIENLSSKQGGENEKLIFKILKRGEKLKLDTAETEADLVDGGLRYDLTLPLSRYYSNHANELPSPFKALQMGNVWRADRPQRGRYRQFMQCDIDILGEPTNLAEIELILATTTLLGKLDFKNFTIRINDRRILKAMAAYSGFAPESYDTVFIILDKMDKIGLEGVREELEKEGFDKACVDKYLAMFEEITNDVQGVRYVKEKLEGVAEEIRALGVKCLPVQCDVTQIDQIQSAVDEVVKGLGTVDILVNNAGGGSCIPLEDLPDEGWRKVLSLDLDGAFYCMKYFGTVMLEKGYGRVINISSILGKGGLKELPVIAYASAKGGVINMTRQAAIEWATKGVTVNALCPGFFASEANGPEAMEAMNDFIETRSAMCRPGNPGELDSSIVYLAAKESSYVTAAILTCDGGWTAV